MTQPFRGVNRDNLCFLLYVMWIYTSINAIVRQRNVYYILQILIKLSNSVINNNEIKKYTIVQYL